MGPVIVAALSLILVASAAHAAPFGLRDAAAYALHNAPSLDATARQKIVTELEYKNSVSAFLPSLDLVSSHGLLRNYPQLTPYQPWVSSFGLALTETLYDNGEAITRKNIASVQEQLADLNLGRDRDNLILNVANSFFALSLARRNLEIQQEQHAVLKLQVELVRDAYRQGVKTRKDYLRFQTQLNRSDIDLLAVRNAVTKADIDLRRTIGVPLESPASFEFLLDDALPEPERTPVIHVEAHRDYKIAELTRQTADLNTDIVRRKQWPVLGLTAAANYGSSNYLFTGIPESVYQTKSWTALLSLSYNFFDFGTRRRNTEIAAQQAMIQSDTLEGGLLDLRQTIDKLYIDLRQSTESYNLSQELLKLERANLALITNEYRQGKVQYLDYINSLQNFASAKTTYYTSLYDLRRQQLALHYHEGNIYDAVEGRN
jgi:outer membrane protein